MQIVDLDLETIREGLADGSILLIDVREPHEFQMGHIPDSVSLPLSTFDPSEIPRPRDGGSSFPVPLACVRAMPDDGAGRWSAAGRALCRRFQGMGDCRRGNRTRRLIRT